MGIGIAKTGENDGEEQFMVIYQKEELRGQKGYMGTSEDYDTFAELKAALADMPAQEFASKVSAARAEYKPSVTE